MAEILLQKSCVLCHVCEDYLPFVLSVCVLLCASTFMLMHSLHTLCWIVLGCDMYLCLKSEFEKPFLLICEMLVRQSVLSLSLSLSLSPPCWPCG